MTNINNSSTKYRKSVNPFYLQTLANLHFLHGFILLLPIMEDKNIRYTAFKILFQRTGINIYFFERENPFVYPHPTFAIHKKWIYLKLVFTPVKQFYIAMLETVVE